MGLTGAVRPKHHPSPLSLHAARYPENHLGRYFSTEAANLKWVTDISDGLTEDG